MEQTPLWKIRSERSFIQPDCGCGIKIEMNLPSCIVLPAKNRAAHCFTFPDIKMNSAIVQKEDLRFPTENYAYVMTAVGQFALGERPLPPAPGPYE